jgi:hypothetical protein
MTIEREQFDFGGEGVAYHDTTTNNIGGKYRNEGVDLFRCEDYGGYAPKDAPFPA